MTLSVTIIFVCFFLAKIILVLYLDFRNHKHIELNQEKVPELFSDFITPEDHLKAAHYSVNKIKAGYIFTLFNYLLILFWTLGGGFNLIQKFVAALGVNDLLTGTIFFLLFGLIGVILQLPESIYSTFVIEEKYGFNKMTPKMFIVDHLKEIIISFIIGTPLIMAILFLMMKLENYWWFLAFLLMTVIKFTLLFIYPIWIAPLFNKFTPLESNEVKEKVEELLKRTGFVSKGLFVMDASKRSSHGNAYFTGFGKNKRIVFFDTLLESLTSGEIVAVLAHELGHLKKKHIIKKIILDSLFTLVGFYILGILYKSKVFYLAHGVTEFKPWLGIAIFLMVTPIYIYLIKPIMAHFSRKHEFEADDFAKEFADAQDLVNALKKLYKDNASTLTPDPIYSKFYYSHPQATERVQNLLEKSC